MKIISRFLLVFLVLILSSCFSPWRGDEGTLTIHFPGNSANRAASMTRSVVTDDEVPTLRYKFILTGPGGTKNYDVPAGQPSFTVDVVPGTWTITVKAYGKKNGNQDETEIVLRAMGITTVTVTAGQTNEAAVSMVTTTEVATWEDLLDVVYSEQYAGYEEREEYILVKKDLIVTEEGATIYNKKITILADNGPVTITRGPNFEHAFFFLESGGHLTLGEKGDLENTLILNGNADGMNADVEVNTSLVVINENTIFTMNDGVTLQNNKIIADSDNGGGITMIGGTFTMNGGKISGNSVMHGGGGGITMIGGTFTMNGGKISGNSFVSGGGGGVKLDVSGNGNTLFIMEGGSITGNTTSGNGGGVNLVGKFEGTSNTITFTMNGGTITGNTAAGNGGGVYVGIGRIFNQNVAPTAISGNTSADNQNITKETPAEEVPVKKPIAEVTTWNDLLVVLQERDEEYILVKNTLIVASTASITRKITILADNGSVTIERGSGFREEFFLVKEGGQLTLGQTGNPAGTSLVLDGNKTNYFFADAALITINSGAAFIMNDGVTLQNNYVIHSLSSGITVNGGTFTMNGGKISGNNADIDGGGVFIKSNGTFIMKKGEISGNTAGSNGGGVCVASGGTFTMSEDSIIKGNEAYNGGGVYVASAGEFTMGDFSSITDNTSDTGGGVYVEGIFTMSGNAKISSNNVTLSSGYGGGGVFVSGANAKFTMKDDAVINKNNSPHGGGVYLADFAQFNMNGGMIGGESENRNIASLEGGGVYVEGFDAEFIMDDGVIEGNEAKSNGGGGVYVSEGIFKMKSGTIKNNTASGSVNKHNGGGVFVTNGTFSMNDGSIEGNNALNGGGVYVDRNTIFTKSGGIIYGDDVAESLKNIAENDAGNAIYAEANTGNKWLNNTVSHGNNLEYHSNVFTGTWDYTVGDIGPSGGYIFYVKGTYSDGWRYLEVAPANKEFTAPWGALGQDVSGTQREIGTGKENTRIIVEFLGTTETGHAAQRCDKLIVTCDGVEYSGWFLPSSLELGSIYQATLGGFSGEYWTSSQATNDNAFYQDFSSINQPSKIKTSTCKVRAIRAF